MILQIGRPKSFITGLGIRPNLIVLGDTFLTEIEFRTFSERQSKKSRKLLVYSDKSVDLTWLTRMISSKNVFVAFQEDQEDFQICWVSISEIAE